MQNSLENKSSPARKIDFPISSYGMFEQFKKQFNFTAMIEPASHIPEAEWLDFLQKKHHKLISMLQSALANLYKPDFQALCSSQIEESATIYFELHAFFELHTETIKTKISPEPNKKLELHGPLPVPDLLKSLLQKIKGNLPIVQKQIQLAKYYHGIFHEIDQARDLLTLEKIEIRCNLNKLDHPSRIEINFNQLIPERIKEARLRINPSYQIFMDLSVTMNKIIRSIKQPSPEILSATFVENYKKFTEIYLQSSDLIYCGFTPSEQEKIRFFQKEINLVQVVMYAFEALESLTAPLLPENIHRVEQLISQASLHLSIFGYSNEIVKILEQKFEATCKRLTPNQTDKPEFKQVLSEFSMELDNFYTTFTLLNNPKDTTTKLAKFQNGVKSTIEMLNKFPEAKSDKDVFLLKKKSDFMLRGQKISVSIEEVANSDFVDLSPKPADQKHLNLAGLKTTSIKQLKAIAASIINIDSQSHSQELSCLEVLSGTVLPKLFRAAKLTVIESTISHFINDCENASLIKLKEGYAQLMAILSEIDHISVDDNEYPFYQKRKKALLAFVNDWLHILRKIQTGDSLDTVAIEINSLQKRCEIQSQLDPYQDKGEEELPVTIDSAGRIKILQKKLAIALLQEEGQEATPPSSSPSSGLNSSSSFFPRLSSIPDCISFQASEPLSLSSNEHTLLMLH